MTRGRKPDSARLVEQLAGSVEAKSRLAMILEALAGRLRVADACRRLGLSERRFHALRNQTLQASLESLEPLPAGRRSSQATAVDARVTALEATVRDLRLDLRAAQIREEVALAMPQLLRKPSRTKRAARRTHHRRRASVKRDGPGG